MEERSYRVDAMQDEYKLLSKIFLWDPSILLLTENFYFFCQYKYFLELLKDILIIWILYIRVSAFQIII